MQLTPSSSINPAMADQVCSSDKCGKSCSDTDDQNKLQQVVEEGVSIVATKGAFCKCGEGWTCVITKTDDGAPDSGKIFFNCGEGCTCEIGTGTTAGTCTLSEAGVGGTDAFCKCGDGWTCVITKTEGPKMGKAFAECGDGCCITTAA